MMLAMCFSAVIMLIVYLHMKDFAQIIIALTESQSEIRELFFDYAYASQYWIALLVVGFLISNIVISITYTHKLIGPTIAFRNQLQRIRSGDFSKKVSLRKGDAFIELAEELNELTDTLEKNGGFINKVESLND